MNFLPLWLIFIITILAIFSSLVTGYFFGRRAANSSDARESTPPIGAVVGSMLGLLAFLLALTFNSSTSRFETRKQLLVDDVVAIGAVFDQAQVLAPADRAQVRQLLRDYVGIYIALEADPDRFAELLAENRLIQDELWSIASAYMTDSTTSNAIAGRFATLVAEMKALHIERLVYSMHYRIDPTIWLGLFVVGLLSTGALGFQFGISGGTRYQISFLLAVCFGAILVLIMDLERPTEGTIRIDTVPLQDLRARMG